MTTTPIAPPPATASPPRLMSFEEYCAYIPDDDQRYELVEGLLIPMAAPTGLHTAIIRYLVYCFQQVLAERALRPENSPKWVIVSDLGVRTALASSRLPDITICSQELWAQVVDRPGSGVLDFDATPFLVVEVVSQDWRVDYEAKRLEYSALGIPVYVLVDAKRSLVRVMDWVIEHRTYDIVDFAPGETVVIPGFPELHLAVDDVLNPPIVEVLQEQAVRDRQRILEEERDRAQTAEQRAQVAEEQAQLERQRAETERQRAATERQRAEAERQRVERLLALLRENGIDELGD